MSLLVWIVLGLIAGFIGSKIVNRRGEGIVLDVLLGVVGAVIGGWLFRVFGAAGVNGLNLYSLFVAVLGSVVFLVVYHALRGSRRAW
jgi:uncharacterized membrane protein YeaQ/YmgE (transglycosylase-associated protein family)